MPTAGIFEFEGVDNGFPFCFESFTSYLKKVNVNNTNITYWTTLSGVNKDNVGTFSEEELAAKFEESRALAMSWYWNLHKALLSGTVIRNGTTSGTDTINNAFAEYIITDYAEDPPVATIDIVTPKERTCIPYYFSETDLDYDYYIRRNYSSSYGFLQTDLRTSKIVLLILDGEPVGFALSNVAPDNQTGAVAINADGPAGSGTSCTVSIGGYSNDKRFPDQYVLEMGYVELDGFHVVAYAEARDGPEGYPIVGTVSLDPLSASCVRTPEKPGEWDVSQSVTITGFELYTYPT